MNLPGAPVRGKNAKGSRKRRRWTADEEKAVKDGYQLYGDKWAKILREFSVLRKGGRTSADVRDKFRNLVKKDPALLGGLTVQIGDKYLDLSAATKIAAISRSL